MKIAAFVFAGVFALGAIVQLNDPDPILWILAYLAGAGLSLAAALDRRLFGPSLIAAVFFGVWFLSIASSLGGAPQEAFTSFKMQATSHEEPREAAGLALLAIWNGALAVWARRESIEHESTEGGSTDKS